MNDFNTNDPVHTDDCDIFRGMTRITSDFTDSRETFFKIERWIRKCSDHEKCNQYIDPTWMPTRLLDLGVASDSCIQVIASNQHFKKLPDGGSFNRYMTLSHCWGGLSGVPKLLQKDESLLPKLVQFEQSLKTFRDAVTITRCLGIRYLWIDCLCIIQDSEEDWQREATLMMRVYQGSYCNIAATASPDALTGCFSSRTVDVNPPAVFTDFHALNLWTDSLRSAFKSSPLFQRGWVLQERVLAPRTIHFTASQVFFECHTILACELFPLGIPDPHAVFCIAVGCATRNDFIHKEQTEEDVIARGVSARTLAWNRLVEWYSALALTKASDKLPAFDGVKSKFLEPGDEYFAGIWRSHMPMALLWRTNPACENAIRHTDRAPSWSWASVDGPIDLSWTESHSSHLSFPLAELIGASRRSLNITGSNRPNHQLYLRGIFARVTFVKKGNLVRVHSLSGRLYDEDAPKFVLDDCGCNGAMFFDTPRDPQDDLNMVVWVLFIKASVLGPIRTARYSTSGVLYGLALQNEGDAFKRIGTVSIFNQRGPYLESLLEYLQYPKARDVTLI